MERAAGIGASVVTPPTPFYGAVTLVRVHDRWNNLSWLDQPTPGQPDPRPAWQGGPDVVFGTIDEFMRGQARSAQSSERRTYGMIPPWR